MGIAIPWESESTSPSGRGVGATGCALTEQHRSHLLEVGADLLISPEVGGVVHQTRQTRKLRDVKKITQKNRNEKSTNASSVMGVANNTSIFRACLPTPLRRSRYLKWNGTFT